MYGIYCVHIVHYINQSTFRDWNSRCVDICVGSVYVSVGVGCVSGCVWGVCICVVGLCVCVVL